MDFSNFVLQKWFQSSVKCLKITEYVDVMYHTVEIWNIITHDVPPPHPPDHEAERCVYSAYIIHLVPIAK